VVKVDTDENLLLVRGSVPGPSGQYIFIRKTSAVLRPQGEKKGK